MKKHARRQVLGSGGEFECFLTSYFLRRDIWLTLAIILATAFLAKGSDEPTFLAHPASERVHPGDRVTVSVSVTPAVFQYAWLRNGEPIEGATSDKYEIPNFQATNGGAYSVVVYRENPDVAVVSRPAYLVIEGDISKGPDKFKDRVDLNQKQSPLLFDSMGAGVETNEPSDGELAAAKSTWFEWKAPQSGEVIFTTAGSTFDTRLTVFRLKRSAPGNPALKDLNPEPVTADDNGGPSFSSLVLVSVTNDDRLFISADSGWSPDGGINGGTNVLSWTFTSESAAPPTIKKQPKPDFLTKQGNTFKRDKFDFTVQMQKQKPSAGAHDAYEFVWYRDGMSIWTNIDKKMSTYGKAHGADESDVGTYHVVVRDLNDTSRPAVTSRKVALYLRLEPEVHKKDVGNFGSLVSPISSAVSYGFTCGGTKFDRYLAVPGTFGGPGVSGVTYPNDGAAAKPMIYASTANCTNFNVDTAIQLSKAAVPATSVICTNNSPAIVCNGNSSDKLSILYYRMATISYRLTVFYRTATAGGKTGILLDWNYRD